MKNLTTAPNSTADPGVVLGAYARIDALRGDEVRDQLRRLEGVTIFDLDAPHKLGIVLEALDLDDAHHRLTSRVAQVEGVQGVWPISVELPNPHTDHIPPPHPRPAE